MSEAIPVDSLVGALGELAATTTLAELPAEARSSVPQRVLDILGICVRATTIDTAQQVLAYVTHEGGRPAATAIGTGLRLPSAAAALANGTLAHSLDSDDTHLPSILHPSASVVPAAIAAAQAVGRAGSFGNGPTIGERLISAVAVGLEVTVRLGMAGYDAEANGGAGQSIYFEHGQHATSICGAVGSAAAASMLLCPGDAAAAANAMAVACSMASGIIEANRTGGTVKRIHCGWAAHSGVTAAELVRRGLTGAPTALEGRFGFFEAFLRDEWEIEAITRDLGTAWCVADIFYKPYPANHFTHGGIDAAIRLREAGLQPEDIAAIHLGVATPTVRTIGEPIDAKRTPATGYQAQFSGPYTVVAALLGGGGLGLGLGDFSDELANHPLRRELMAKVSVSGDAWCDSIYPHQFPAVLTVETTDGRTIVERVEANRGGPGWPLTDVELATKFSDNVDGLLDPGRVARVVDDAAALAELTSLDPLLDALAGPFDSSV